MTATSVFCSVADPVTGLQEIAKVVKPDGQMLLLEHFRPRNPVLGWVADRLNPIINRLIGPNINRQTETVLTTAGLDITSIQRHGVWREMAARAT